MTDAAPLILTLALDADAQARFDRLRAAHFPPEHNLLQAHVTLFHALPGAEFAAIEAALAVQSQAEAPFPVAATGLRPLGRGVAYALASPALAAVRARLAALWAPWLGAQDRQGFRPHVTVQNKATPEAARALLRELQAGFAPFTVAAEGLLLWRYRGGPWEAAGRFPFRYKAGGPASTPPSITRV